MRTTIENQIGKRLEEIRRMIKNSSPDGHRVRIIAVTKGQPVETIQAAMQCGLTEFGENYPLETMEKQVQLGAGAMITWRMIGHLQSRKIPLVVKSFQYFDALDTSVLAQKLNYRLTMAGKTMPVLIQVNAAGEASKGGWDISDDDNWAKISDELEGVFALANIRIDGVMTMPPLTDRAETNRFFFRTARRFLDFLRMRFPDAPLTQLSMGTSQDFAVAVEEGATMVRLGTALLGARNYQLKEGL